MGKRRPGCCQDGSSLGTFIVIEMIITKSFNRGSTHLLKKPWLCFHWTCLSDDLCWAPVSQTLFGFTSFQCSQSHANNSFSLHWSQGPSSSGVCRRAVPAVGQPPQSAGSDIVFLAYTVMAMWFQTDLSMGLKCNSSFLSALCAKNSLFRVRESKDSELLLGNNFTQTEAESGAGTWAHWSTDMEQQQVGLLSTQTQASAC